MQEHYFEHPVQTATVIGSLLGIDRGTLTRACSGKRLGGASYRSGDTWLIDTSHPDFKEWLTRHREHHKSKKDQTCS